MTSWKAACAWGRLSLKVGVISPLSTLKGSWCRWTAATCRVRPRGAKVQGQIIGGPKAQGQAPCSC